MRQVNATRVLALSAALLLLACGVPKKYLADRDHFNTAIESFREAANTLNRAAGSSGTAEMTESLRNQLLLHLETGLASADSVSDGFLEWLHPELPRQFRANLVAAQRGLESALVDRDPRQQDAAQERYIAWEQYWSQHAEKLYNKANP